MNKSWVWLPVTLVVGLMLGGWGPRQEVRHLKQELELARTETPRRANGAAALGALGQVIPLPDRARAGPREPAPELRADPTAPAPEIESIESEEGPGPAAEDHSETMRRGMEQAMEAWRLRSELVRNTFVASAALNAGEAARFDTAVAAMNLRLRTDMQQLADRIRAEEPVTPEDGLRLMNELSGHVVRAYDDLDRALPASWRVAAGPGFNLADLVDPSVAEPLIGLEDRLDGLRADPGRRGRRP
jgi:hypothetical protein